MFDEKAVSGVIDIEALGSGTRAFDYATLLTMTMTLPKRPRWGFWWWPGAR